MFDKIFGWFESFVQGFALQSILQHFQWVDWLTVGFALLGIVMGIRSGMMGELGGILLASFLKPDSFKDMSIAILSLSNS